MGCLKSTIVQTGVGSLVFRSIRSQPIVIRAAEYELEISHYSVRGINVFSTTQKD